MRSSHAGATTGSTALLFLPPPAVEATDGFAQDHSPTPPARERQPRPGVPDASEAAPLRMLRGAREAATGMNITDAQIRAVLADPASVDADPTNPQRTRFTRDGVAVTTGGDGMILRVARRRH